MKLLGAWLADLPDSMASVVIIALGTTIGAIVGAAGGMLFWLLVIRP